MTTRTHSIQGRPYIQISELQEGDKIEVDDGFDCAKPNTSHFVFKDEEGFYIKCSRGKHLLDGQLEDDGDTLIGVFKCQ